MRDNIEELIQERIRYLRDNTDFVSTLFESLIGNPYKKFIELHGGKIWIESEQGKGSRFAFIMPVRQCRAD